MSIDVKKMFDLSGRIAVITGGGGQLPGTMAEALGQCGLKVALLDINLEQARIREEKIKENGGQAKAFACDVLSQDQLLDTLSAISKLWGDPDVLVNGAGGNQSCGTTTLEFIEPQELAQGNGTGFVDLDIEDYKKVFDLNSMGVILPTQIFSKPMIKNGRGSIVNICSITAITPLTKVGAYSAAKAAVANFTSWLAVHYAHTGVCVNAIAPGFFMTEQLRYLHVDQKTGELLPRAKKAIAHTPMGRYGEPDELVSTLIWLLSDASRYVTGVLVPVDGGYSSYTI